MIQGKRVCEVCGADLAGRRKGARYCSPACRQAAHRRQRRAQAPKCDAASTLTDAINAWHAWAKTIDPDDLARLLFIYSSPPGPDCYFRYSVQLKVVIAVSEAIERLRLVDSMQDMAFWIGE